MTSNTRHKTISICLSIILLLSSSMTQADLVSGTDAGKRTMSKFMINLAKFITWPDAAFENDGSAFQYCILGDDAFGGILGEAMKEKVARGRSFTVRRMDLTDTDAAKTCHVVFISTTSMDAVTPVIDSLAGTSILTVGEIENFAQQGGMIGFYGKGRKVALAVNKNRLEGAGLNASSRLYRASNDVSNFP